MFLLSLSAINTLGGWIGLIADDY